MVEQTKPSGIDWIGDIPTKWDVRRIKYIIQNNADGIKVGPFGSALTNEVVGNEEGAYKIYGQANLIRKDFDYGDNYVTEENYRRLINYEVLPEDIAVSMMGTIGKCSVVPQGIQPGIMDSHLIKIRLSNKMLPRFFEYIYESCVVYEQLVVNSKGSIMNGLNSSIVKGVFVTVPSMDEQQDIIDFLDAQCSKIDSIISDLEKQIETLQKYKKSLILETVTKGLNKNVPMKSSGIDWIGDIPAHWDIKRIKDVSKMQTGTTPPNNEGVNIDGDGVNWFTPGDFIDGSIELFNSEKHVNNEAIQRESIKIYPKHSILFVGIASIGKLGYFENSCYSNQQITAIKPNNVESSKYISYALLASMDYTKSNALYTTVPIINNAYLGIIKIPFPEVKEQKEIISYLDKKCSQIDVIVKDKQEQLEKIKQHKKSLIYEYVTGKKRVKEAINGN